MRHLAFRLARAFILAVSLLPALAAAQEAPVFKKEQLDQMLAPIALYPDSLLSQVLMAATYPADVADAAKWSKANPNQKGDEAVKAVQSQPWDPSVQSLVAFPQVIQTMGDKPDWVQNLGDAFLASSKDVLDSVQRLRAQAQQAGNLKSSEQQNVVVEQAPQTQQTVIKIEPANPQVVYVPAYNPTVVYGTWAYPAYPPYYYPPPPAYYPGAALASGIAFGIGVAAVGSLWGDCNWGRGDVNINVNKYNTANVNRQISANQTNFQHNAANRRGVPYRDQKSQQQFGNKRGGREPAGRLPRPRSEPRRAAPAGASFVAGTGNRLGTRLPSPPDKVQAAILRARAPGASSAARPVRKLKRMRGGDNALRGADNPAQARQQADRGNASRQSMGQHGGGGGRAGGGGGGRGGGRR